MHVGVFNLLMAASEIRLSAIEDLSVERQSVMRVESCDVHDDSCSSSDGFVPSPERSGKRVLQPEFQTLRWEFLLVYRTLAGLTETPSR